MNTIKCPKCHGTGNYNNSPNTCYGCEGKGYQTLADTKRNFGYIRHMSIDGNTCAPIYSSMADGFFNDLVIHNCSGNMTLKAARKHGKLDLPKHTVTFPDDSTYDVAEALYSLESAIIPKETCP